LRSSRGAPSSAACTCKARSFICDVSGRVSQKLGLAVYPAVSRGGTVVQPYA